MAMNLETLEALNRLKSAFEEDPRRKKLLQAEKEMESDPEAKRLTKKKDLLTEEYEQARFRYGENSEQAKSAWRSLYLIKKELDELPVCEAYRKAYAPMALLCRQMDTILFDSFRDETDCGGKI